MKKTASLLLGLALILTFAGCSKSENYKSGSIEATPSEKTESQKIETILTPNEYILYQNIFYNDQAAYYVNKETTKRGIFTVLYDEYNSTVRYYVWGYNDNTKCCDWQWEIVPDDINSLPNPGSTIDVKGIFTQNDDALDGYRIEKANINVVTEYTGNNVDVDTTTMGGTLERVQVLNMQAYSDKFEGKTVAVYGRIEKPTSVQHPYYDNCFSQEFVSDNAVQAIGTKVVVSGTYSGGVITDASVKTSNDF